MSETGRKGRQSGVRSSSHPRLPNRSTVHRSRAEQGKDSSDCPCLLAAKRLRDQWDLRHDLSRSRLEQQQDIAHRYRGIAIDVAD